MTDFPHTFGDYLEAYGPDPHADALNEIAAGLRHDRSQRRDEALRARIDQLEAEMQVRAEAKADAMLEREFDRLGIPEHDRPAIAARTLQEAARNGGQFDLESATWLHRHDQEEDAAEWFAGELDQHEQRIGRTLTDTERRRIYDRMSSDEVDVEIAHAVTSDLTTETEQGRANYVTERVADLRAAEQRESESHAAAETEATGDAGPSLDAPGEAGIEARAQAVRRIVDGINSDQE